MPVDVTQTDQERAKAACGCLFCERDVILGCARARRIATAIAEQRERDAVTRLTWDHVRATLQAKGCGRLTCACCVKLAGAVAHLCRRPDIQDAPSVLESAADALEHADQAEIMGGVPRWLRARAAALRSGPDG